MHTKHHPSVDFHRQQTALIKEGYLSTSMLFGYVNAARELNDLKPYRSLNSMQQTLTRKNIEPRIVFFGSSKRHRLWWPAAKTAAILCEVRQRDNDTFLPREATDEELMTGDWADCIVTARLTGIRKNRVSRIGSHNPQFTRMHPITRARLFHVPSIREKGYYRDVAFIRKHFGDVAADAMIALRPQKKWTTGGCSKTAVYAPELAHI